jgi:hypothetical protein
LEPPDRPHDLAEHFFALVVGAVDAQDLAAVGARGAVVIADDERVPGATSLDDVVVPRPLAAVRQPGLDLVLRSRTMRFVHDPSHQRAPQMFSA